MYVCFLLPSKMNMSRGLKILSLCKTPEQRNSNTPTEVQKELKETNTNNEEKTYTTLLPMLPGEQCVSNYSDHIQNTGVSKIKAIENIRIYPAQSPSSLTTFNSEDESRDKISYSDCDDSRDKDFNIEDEPNASSDNHDSCENVSTDEEDVHFEKNDVQHSNIIRNILRKRTLNLLEKSKPTEECKNYESFSSSANYIEKEQNVQLETDTTIANDINRRKKHARCAFCAEDVVSKNFLRHLQRHHRSEKEVEDILKLNVNSRERRSALALLRNRTNFDLYISGTLRPHRQPQQKKEIDVKQYYPCPYCRTLLTKGYIKRHVTLCILHKSKAAESNNSNKNDYVSQAQTVTACATDVSGTISKLNVKKQVFDVMKGDEIAFVAKKDILIVNYGDSYLKKHKRERMAYACSNRMRELARLLISYRSICNKPEVAFQDLIHPKNFDNVLHATRNLVGYDPIKKLFRAPSLAMHLGTSLKLICDELSNLILKEAPGFSHKTPVDAEARLKDVKNFRKLVQSRWNIEVASLAQKDLHEKRWSKPLIVPLISDIKTFREESLKMAFECETQFLEQQDNKATYKLLVNITLSLLIVFNRRRIGDVQFLKIADYNNDQRSSSLEGFENVLTETEKMLTTKYKRVVNSGKGSRAVVILIPQILEKYIDLLLKHRSKYILEQNEYVFASPDSQIPWGKGDVALRILATKMQLKQPQAITSNKLRKHIATVMQLLNLTKDDEKQFSKFMGHTQKTHEEFYELPVDVYQTAKVSKILLMMEKGDIPVEYKGKSLSEINFNENLEFAIESEDDAEITINDANSNTHYTSDRYTEAAEANAIKSKYPSLPSPEKQRVKRKIDNEIKNMNMEEQPTKKKTAWSSIEVCALEQEFHPFIRKRTYPSGLQIKQFLDKTKMKRSVAIVKAKLQHIIKTKN